MVLMFGMLAFAVDLGIRDAGPHAIADLRRFRRPGRHLGSLNARQLGLAGHFGGDARQRPGQRRPLFAGLNPVSGAPPTLDRLDDVTFGRLDDLADRQQSSELHQRLHHPTTPRGSASAAPTDQNGEVPMFFARVLGISSVSRPGRGHGRLHRQLRGLQDAHAGQPTTSTSCPSPWTNKPGMRCWRKAAPTIGHGTSKPGSLPRGRTASARSTCIRKAPARPATAARSISAVPTTAPPTFPGKSATASAPTT